MLKPGAHFSGPMQPSVFRVILLLFFVTGFILRLIRIDELSLWVDEFVHYNRARYFLEGTSALWTNDNNGILYTVFILPFFKIFGDSVFWARFPSALFGAGSIVVAGYLGKKLFNPYVGLIAAFLGTFSLFLIFWSRLSRNYSIYEFFFLLFLLVLWKFLESGNRAEKPVILSDRDIDLKYLLFIPVVFLLAVLSHRLIFLSLIPLGLYLGIMGILVYNKKNEAHHFKYSRLGIFSLSVFGILFLLWITGLLPQVLSLILPVDLLEWVLPGKERLEQYWTSHLFHNFSLYIDVFTYELGMTLLILGLAGILLGWIKNFRPSLFLTLFLVIHFLLLSFIFIEPALPKFMVVLVPIFHLFLGVFFYEAYRFLKGRFQVLSKSAGVAGFIFLVLVFLFSSTRFGEIRELLTAKKRSGFVVDRKLSQWSFVDYKEVCDYLKPQLEEEDIVFATVPQPFELYLDRKVYQFRQNFYNREQHRYEAYPIEITNDPSAKSIENLSITYQNNNRGWLLADYYFDNVMTGLKAKLWGILQYEFS